jgi:hypothetical protein
MKATSLSWITRRTGGGLKKTAERWGRIGAAHPGKGKLYFKDWSCAANVAGG